LPEAGGIRDQGAGELGKMSIVLSIYDAIRSYNDNEGKDVGEWIKQHKNDAWRIVKRVNELRNENGKI